MANGTEELPGFGFVLSTVVGLALIWLGVAAVWGTTQETSAAVVLGVSLAATLLLGSGWMIRGAMRISRLRELRQVQREISGMTVPAMIVARDGDILAQNAAAISLIGDMAARSICLALAQAHADPESRRTEINRTLSRRDCCNVELGSHGSFRVHRVSGGQLQIWRAEQPSITLDDPLADSGDEFSRLPVSLLTLDEHAVILRVNDAARTLLGDPQPGQPLAHFLDGLGREIGDWVCDICAGRMVSGSEVLHLKGSGGDRFVQVSLTRSAVGRATAVLSDASAMKTLEAQFVQSQKMQAIGQLAGGVAHDFNNLLTAITGHCDLLMLRHDKSDPSFSDLDQISQNANRAAALVRQLLAFSRKQTLKPQVMDLRDTLADLTHLLNRLVGEPVYLTFDHDPSLRMIRADRRQFEQVIMNLVVNARDAMPAGGNITITTQNFRSEGEVIGRAILPPGEFVRVQVQDQGCGIPAEELGKIFEPFYSTKRTGEGTGLGLSTVYGIVKQTGGYVFCDSVLGEGSIFSLFFPAHDRFAAKDAVPESVPIPVPVAVRHMAEANILLVEDEAPVRAFASRALKLQGINVIEATSAEEALSILADTRLKVDVFVTDVVMPGMDGPAWVRTALIDRPQTRVIFMSGYAEDVFSEGNVPIAGSAFLAKPFSLTELTALVAQHLQADREMTSDRAI